MDERSISESCNEDAVVQHFKDESVEDPYVNDSNSNSMTLGNVYVNELNCNRCRTVDISSCSCSQSDRRKIKKSLVWHHFDYVDNNQKTASCKICDKIVRHSGNSSNLLRHLEIYHNPIAKAINVEKSRLNRVGSTENNLSIDKYSNKTSSRFCNSSCELHCTKWHYMKNEHSKEYITINDQHEDCFMLKSPKSATNTTNDEECLKKPITQAIVNLIVAGEGLGISSIYSTSFDEFLKAVDMDYNLPPKPIMSKMVKEKLNNYFL